MMRMKILGLKAVSIVFTLVIIGCNSSSEKEKLSKKPQKKPRKSKPQTLDCKPSIVKKILDDGRTIISTSDALESTLLIWDAFGRKVKSRVEYVFDYLNFSHSGKYLIRKMSQNQSRFQILNVLSSSAKYGHYLQFGNGVTPKLAFSRDEKFIFAYYKNRGTEYKLHVYNVKNNDFTFGKTIHNLRFVEMAGADMLVTVQSKDFRRGKTTIVTRNFEKRTNHSFTIQIGKIHRIMLSKPYLILKSHGSIMVYDLSVRKLIYTLASYKIIDIDRFDKKLLVEKEQSLEVIDLKTGLSDLTFKKNSIMDIDSCKLNFAGDLVLCENLKNPNAIVFNNFVLGQTREVCLDQ